MTGIGCHPTSSSATIASSSSVIIIDVHLSFFFAPQHVHILFTSREMNVASASNPIAEHNLALALPMSPNSSNSTLYQMHNLPLFSLFFTLTIFPAFLLIATNASDSKIFISFQMSEDIVNDMGGNSSRRSWGGAHEKWEWGKNFHFRFNV